MSDIVQTRRTEGRPESGRAPGRCRARPHDDGASARGADERPAADRSRACAPRGVGAALTALASLTALLGAPPPASAQDVPPDQDWRTVRTEHFRVTFTPELESLARHTAERAEVAHARLAAHLADPPEGVIDIVVTDHVDLSSGFARPFPSNRIVLHAKPPTADLALGNYDDWIDLVVTHELVHVFHFDQAGGFGHLLRAIFGRVPSSWPLFPAVATPTWSIEGLATYFESRLTGAGRVRGSYHEMIVRTAVLEDAFPGIDGAEGIGAGWPGGQSAYVFGSLFIDHLAREHGLDAPRLLVDATAGSWLPPFTWFDHVADEALGASFTDAWAAWRTKLERRYARLADSLRARGLTPSERLTHDGRWLSFPRVSPDGRRVAFAAADGRDDPATKVFDARTGAVRTVAERGQLSGELGPAAWLPGGQGLVVAEFRFADAYRVYEDLFRVDPDGRERRLTRGGRVAEPHVAPDGRRVVAVQATAGTNRLVLYDLETGELRALTDAVTGRHWALPRWSPDGGRIAVARWARGGNHDVVVIDTSGAVLTEIAHDRAIESSPAWSPDGRYVLFWSDRSGIPNLYAYDLNPRAAALRGAAAGRLHQVTNVLGGAFDPAVSPDGRWIYFVGYHADGFHLERMPFEPGRWRPPAAPRAHARAGEAPAPRAGASGADAPRAVRPAAATPAGSSTDAGTPATAVARPFSAWPSLRPRFWMPTASIDDAGTFVGAFTLGEDVVGRHSYEVAAAYAPDERRVEGEIGYRYAGLGNPVLGVSAAQSWDHVGFARAGGERIDIHGRERSLVASATLIRRRLRSAAALTVGGEWVDEHRLLQDAPGVGLVDPNDRLVGGFAGIAFANYRAHPYSISREHGVSLAAEVLQRWDPGVFTHPDIGTVDGSYRQFAGQLATYLDLPLVGFADHVLAMRVAGLWRTGPGAPLDDVGGATGSAPTVLGERIGGPRLFLPVRGYDDDHRHGTRAWVASAEYRFPIALIERGFRVWPAFLDRVSGAVFVDAGDAWCDPATARGLPDACVDDAPMVGAGAELAVDLSLLFTSPFRVRGGVAWPLSTIDDRSPRFYVQFGDSF